MSCGKAIGAKFRGNARAEAALAEVEKAGTPAALEKVTKYLDLEMDEDQAFAGNVRQMAQQIINIQNTIQNQAGSQSAGRDFFKY